MRVTLFDYGAGNLHSLAKGLGAAGVELKIEADPQKAIDTDLFVLPGVGAFGPAAERLAPGRETLRQALQAGLPCLGICLGMQLLFERSEEGPGQGLGVLAGTVTKLTSTRVPHIGWNQVEAVTAAQPLFSSAPPLELGYYAHSYACRPVDTSCVVAWTTHEGDRFPAAVRHGRTFGIQFHPEKSSAPGLALLRRFIEEIRK